MARRHWRFTVRDQYGYVIQNAKVNVFQPGTSNAFTGTAYNAVSGGGAVTNPFTTNSQGEVEAWFDDAQPVDVQVDDNSDTAYRAVNGSGAVISFTTFTEADEIHVAPADDQADMDEAILVPGVSGDIVDIDAGDATAAGAVGKYADAGHQHEYTTLPNAHTASTHTNRTNALWLSSQTAFPQTGAVATTLGTEPNSVRYLAFVDAATNAAVWNFEVPYTWISGALSAQVFWVPIATDGVAHTVRWEYMVKKRAAADDVTAGGTSTVFTGASAARTANQLVLDTTTSTGVTPAAGGFEFVQFTLRRIGADGADTYVGTVGVIGVLITFTADQ